LKETPLVSVIIPTYNRSNYVQKAIDSVLSQSYKNLELIVIDDGSTDDTEEVIRSKYVNKLKYIKQENQGESKARNVGISLSNGKYLAFLDSDDKWHPDKLMHLVKFFEKMQQIDPKTTLVCSSAWLIDGDGNLIKRKPIGRLKNIEKLLPCDYLKKPHIGGPSNIVFLKEHIIDIGGFDEKIKYGEDWDLIIKLRSKYNFKYLDKPLTYYRIHGIEQQKFPSLSSIEKKLRDNLLIIEKNSFITNDQIYVDKLKSAIYERHAFFYYAFQKWDEGKLNIYKAIELNNDLVRNYSNLPRRVSYSFIQGAKILKCNDITEFFSFYFENFLPNLIDNFPVEGLIIKYENKIFANICVNLFFDNGIEKNQEEYLYLFTMSLRKENRFFFSKQLWKKFIMSYFRKRNN